MELLNCDCCGKQLGFVDDFDMNENYIACLECGKEGLQKLRLQRKLEQDRREAEAQARKQIKRLIFRESLWQYNDEL